MFTGIDMISSGIGSGNTTINQIINQSINTAIIFSGNSRRFKDRYLLFEGQPSNLNGYTVLFPSTIQKIDIKTSLLSSGTIKIIKNDTLLETITLTNQARKLVENLSYPLELNDVLKVYAESSIGLVYPQVQIYIA